ncbi:hypothetical protein HPG69_009507 [Diceros bicornis minor]|uniref:Uncharacterized protein n=1 Tax=Diceros bicornis minor TaxID=77932 RepID=A0A7J7F333_DICBM|nr:hypothetical protein HPG69_009507 [Diceros bicornis minor]
MCMKALSLCLNRNVFFCFSFRKSEHQVPRNTGVMLHGEIEEASKGTSGEEGSPTREGGSQDKCGDLDLWGNRDMHGIQRQGLNMATSVAITPLPELSLLSPRGIQNGEEEPLPDTPHAASNHVAQDPNLVVQLRDKTPHFSSLEYPQAPSRTYGPGHVLNPKAQATYLDINSNASPQAAGPTTSPEHRPALPCGTSPSTEPFSEPLRMVSTSEWSSGD